MPQREQLGIVSSYKLGYRTGWDMVVVGLGCGRM